VRIELFKSVDPNWRRVGVAVPGKATRWFGRHRAAFQYAKRNACVIGCRVEAQEQDLAGKYSAWLNWRREGQEHESFI
jgi:hypothetical protein